jgi:hypothetical protein
MSDRKDQLLEGAPGVVGDETKVESASPTLHAKIGARTLKPIFYPVRSGRQDCWGEGKDRS